jgi:hypothetical protein
MPGLSLTETQLKDLMKVAILEIFGSPEFSVDIV